MVNSHLFSPIKLSVLYSEKDLNFQPSTCKVVALPLSYQISYKKPLVWFDTQLPYYKYDALPIKLKSYSSG